MAVQDKDKLVSLEDLKTAYDDLDGGISDVRNTLNHKADAIYDTASGDIASFPDGADGLPVKDLTVGIEPVQSGTGDPSPTNVRPISGWTGANVSRTGKNLCEEILAGYPDTNINKFVGGQYTTGVFYGRKGMNVVASAPNGNRNALVFVGDTKPVVGGPFQYSIAQSTVYTLPETGYYAWYVYNAVTDDVQIELGSTASAYEAYQGQIIPISWQSEAGTVYGGTLDVTTGVLTVDRAGVDMASLIYNVGQGGDIYTDSLKPTILPAPAWSVASGDICSIYKNVAGNQYSSTDGSFAVDGNGRVYIKDSSLDGYTSAQVQQYLSGQKIIYKLKTELEYNLDPVTVNTLLGQNNIWADCGPSTVEYPCDTKLYIDKKLAALVAALS